MGDFIKGTLGTLGQVVLVILGFGGILAGLFSGEIWALVLGIIFLCMAAGIRYWLGHIIRTR
jgi:protein-S-isoprenylcysteine O-methyltransferase Ste14